MKNEYELRRFNSVCPRPEDQLLNYVRNNNYEKISEIIKSFPELLHHVYDDPFYKTIVQIACSDYATKITKQTLKTLLENNADIFSGCQFHDGKECLHFAVLTGNEQILSCVINHIVKSNPSKINSTTEEGETALVVLIKEGGKDMKNMKQMAEMLVKAGIDVNKADIENKSAILYAARKGYSDIVKLLLAQSGIDLDSHTTHNKTARTIIKEKTLFEGDLPESNNNTSPESELFRFLRNFDEESFISKDLEPHVDIDDGTETLLQLCSRLHLVEATKKLVEEGADTNKTTEKTKETPLEIAVTLGFFKIVEVLLSVEYTSLGNCLSECLKSIDSNNTSIKNRRNCFNLLMDFGKSAEVINVKDKNGNTPLHYAARSGDSEIILELLRKGASLANKNDLGFYDLLDVDPDTLEKHLHSCLSTANHLHAEDFTIKFNYSSLIPSDSGIPIKEDKDEDDDIEKRLLKNTQQELVSEMTVVNLMMQKKEFKHLLKHPLITSFLYLKWHRIEWFFITNVILYFIFWISMLGDIFMRYNNPLYQPNVISSIFYVVLFVSFLIFLLKELYQFIVSPLVYIKQAENIMEMILLATTFIVLLIPNEDIKKQVSAIAILVSSFEIVLIMGHHPKMSTNIVILRTVSWSFFKILAWHAIFIIAFAVSFYTLFNNNEIDSNSSKPMVSQNLTDSANLFNLSNSNISNINLAGHDESEKSNKSESFDNPGTSVFKTFVMLTGEFEAGEIDFDQFPVIGRILFLFFIFMIAIVLFNLLNGLAVSDTQLIKNDAELFAWTARIQHIWYIESMILGDFFPTKICHFFKKSCCCYPQMRFHLPFQQKLASLGCLFPKFIKNYKIGVLANQGGVVLINGTKSDIKLDKKTIKNAKIVVKESDKEESILSELLSIVKKQQEDIYALRSELEKLNKK